MKPKIIVSIVGISLVALGIGLGPFFQARAAPAAVCSWQGGTGNWSDITHWDCGAVPGASDTASIDNYPTVTLDTDVTVENLYLDDGYLTGPGNLTVTGEFTWTGWNASMGGSGLTTIAPSAAMTITGSSAGQGGLWRSLDNFGTLVIGGDAGNRLDIAANVVITNEVGALLDIQSNRPWLWYGGTGDRPAIQNEGTLAKTTAGQAHIIDVLLNSPGLISISTGSLNTSLFAISGPVQLNDADASLRLSGSGGQIDTGVAFNGPGDIIIGGTVSLNADTSIPSLIMEGSLSGSGNLTITQALDWSWWGPSMGGTGVTTIAAGATMILTGNSAGQGGLFRSLDNYGHVIVGGDPGNRIDIGGDVVFTNQPGGLIEIQANRPWLWYGSPGSQAIIDNQGTIHKMITGQATLNGILLNNTGLIDLSYGSLKTDAYMLSGEVRLNDANASIELAGSDGQIVPGAIISGLGKVIVSGTTTLNTDISIRNLVMQGTLTGSSNLTITQTLDWSWWGPSMSGTGVTTIAAGATMTLTGNSAGQGGLFRSLDNYGHVIVGGDPGNRIDIGGGTVLTNQPGGLIEIQANRPWLWYGGSGDRAVIANEGTITKTISGGMIFQDIQFNNTGLIDIANGGITFTHSDFRGDIQLQDANAYVALNGPDNRISDGAVFSGSGWVYNQNTAAVSGSAAAVNFSHQNGTLTLGDTAAANLTITGEFKRTGGYFQSLNGSTLTFAGDQPWLNLEVNTTFENLVVMTGTMLIEVNPTDYATVSGEITNYGVIRKTQAVTGAGNLTFGLTGVAMNIQVQGTLTQTQVDRIDRDHPHADEWTNTGRYWIITPTGADYTVDLTLPHGIYYYDRVLACRYTGSGWECGRTSATADSVTLTGLTLLSDWAIGKPIFEVYIPITFRSP